MGVQRTGRSLRKARITRPSDHRGKTGTKKPREKTSSGKAIIDPREFWQQISQAKEAGSLKVTSAQLTGKPGAGPRRIQGRISLAPKSTSIPFSCSIHKDVDNAKSLLTFKPKDTKIIEYTDTAAEEKAREIRDLSLPKIKTPDLIYVAKQLNRAEREPERAVEVAQQYASRRRTRKKKAPTLIQELLNVTQSYKAREEKRVKTPSV